VLAVAAGQEPPAGNIRLARKAVGMLADALFFWPNLEIGIA
jgi:hypothetical protein